MKSYMKPYLKNIMFAGVGLLVLFLIGACGQKQEVSESLLPVRIGWQLPLATQGQITQVLKNTSILEQHGLTGNFIGFSYGGPQSEAALAGELDVIFVGDQPIVNLISRGGKWKIVSRLFYTKTAIMVPPSSDITSMEQFKGKSIASPFGSVAHREAVLKEQAVGLNPDTDLSNINLDILEISNVVQAGGNGKWGNLDGVAVWEPSTSLFEINGLAKTVDYTITLGVVAISEDFLSSHPDASIAFLQAVIEAWGYYAQNQSEVNKWYISDASLPYTEDILIAASSIDPNIKAVSIKDIDITLDQDHINTLEQAAQWSFERGFTKTKANIVSAVDHTFLDKAISNTSEQ